MTLHSALDLFLHVNRHLNEFASLHPLGVYGLLVAIIFVETGLVVWPFLPGDSLLFAVGALAAGRDSPINLPLVIVLMCVAANCGDLVNYFLGRKVGPKIFNESEDGVRRGLIHRLLSRKHLLEAQSFYDRYGRMTIILARFVPIVRTFAPFVAGVGAMPFPRFFSFSIAGGVLWVTSVTVAGYFFGTIPWVDQHFEVVVLAIIGISLIPVVVTALVGKKPVPVENELV